MVRGFVVQLLITPRYCGCFCKINGAKSSSGRSKAGSSRLGLEARGILLTGQALHALFRFVIPVLVVVTYYLPRGTMVNNPHV